LFYLSASARHYHKDQNHKALSSMSGKMQERGKEL
jgi:hypothetical protein